MGKYTISILATAYFSPLSALILKHTGEEVVAEYRFHPGRDWRFDFAIPSRRVAVEGGGRRLQRWPPYPPPKATCVIWRNIMRRQSQAGA